MVAARPNRTEEVRAKGKVGVRDSADAQARRVTKGKHYFYDYRNYVEVNTEEGFVDATFTRPANESEPSSSNGWCGGCRERRWDSGRQGFRVIGKSPVSESMQTDGSDPTQRA